MTQRRYPAEWEPHEAIWLALPHDREEWGDYFDEAVSSVRQIVAALEMDADAESIRLLVPPDSGLPSGLRRAKACPAHYGDIWLRDTGPIFTFIDNSLTATSFAFNGWGGKYVFQHDANVAQTIATLANVPCESHALVLEGGAIDSNGSGTLLTTRECVLNRNRNANLDQASAETIFATALGADCVLWLDRGLIGDHTDGHVDNLARFVAANRVVCTRASVRGEPNEDIFSEVYRALRSAQTADGSPLEIVDLPSPGVVEGPSGIMAASYCNFLITNRCVLVPVFDVDSDETALAIFASLFPNRRIVAIAAHALLTGGGTIHCISMHQPKQATPRRKIQ